MGSAPQVVYLPTPQQIAEACETLRQQWSPAEQKRRNARRWVGDGPAPWSPPCIDTSLCLARVRRVALEASA